MKNERVWQILIAIIPAILAALVAYYIGTRGEAVAFLEYQKWSNEKLIRLTRDVERITLEILYEKEPIDNLSSVSYQIGNLSKKNIEEFEIYFNFSSRQPSTPLPKLISWDLKPPPGMPTKKIEAMPIESETERAWKIVNFNISDDIWKGLEANFLFLGEEVPDIDIRVSGKGLGIRPYKSSFISEFFVGIAPVLLILIVLFVYHWLFGRRINRGTERVKKLRREKYLKSLKLIPDSPEGLYDIVDTAIKLDQEKVPYKDAWKQGRTA